MAKIHLPTFEAGVITNADMEDLPQGACSELENFRPVNGKLVRTFGMGKVTGLAWLPNSLTRNIRTFVNEKLVGGKEYYGIQVGDNNAFWITGMRDGVSIPPIGEQTYLHKKDRNPVIADGNILRFYPGGIGYAGTDNLKCSAVWLGWIGRKLFNGEHHIPDGFYMYPTFPAADLDFTVAPWLSSAQIGEDIRLTGKVRFAIATVYDYNQISYLCDYASLADVERSFVSIKTRYSSVLGQENRRITGFILYRSDFDDAAVKWSPFRRTTTVDFANDTFAEEVECSFIRNTEYYGSHAKRDENKTLWFNEGDEQDDAWFSAASHFSLSINGVWVWSATSSSNVTWYFNTSMSDKIYAVRHHHLEFDPVWDGSWVLVRYVGSVINGILYGDSCYGGKRIGVLLNVPDQEIDITVNNLLNIDSGLLRMMNMDEMDKDLLVDPSDGIYAGKEVAHFAMFGEEHDFNSGDQWDEVDATLEGKIKVELNGDYFDTTITDFGDPTYENHPYEDKELEPSIEANGDFARLIAGRVWVGGNLVLNPGDKDSDAKNEEHIDGTVCSNFQQYDVFPTANLLLWPDEEGGALTGIASLFNNPVILKKQAIFWVDAKGHPEDMSLWGRLESSHNIGNIAPHGFVEAMGSLYVVYYDGIYGLRANNLAPSDQTPTEKLKISDAIGDVFEALTMTQKENIEGIYHQATSEILWKLGGVGWAFNVLTGAWRGRFLSGNRLFTFDENADIMGVDDSYIVRNANTPAPAYARWGSGAIVISDDRKEVCRSLVVRYKSDNDVRLTIYADGSTSGTTKILPARSTWGTERVWPRVRAKEIRVTLLTDASTTETEIGRITIETSK